MSNTVSRQVELRYPAPTPIDAVALIPVTAEYVTRAGDLINDIVEMGALPAGCIPVDLIIDHGALGAGATLDAGILSGDYASPVGPRTMGTEFVAAAAAATAGVLRRNRVVTTTPALNDRSWGIRFLGANPALAQTIRATLLVRPAPPGI